MLHGWRFGGLTGNAYGSVMTVIIWGFSKDRSALDAETLSSSIDFNEADFCQVSLKSRSAHGQRGTEGVLGPIVPSRTRGKTSDGKAKY